MNKIECKISDKDMVEIDKICNEKRYTRAELLRRVIDFYFNQQKTWQEPYHSDYLSGARTVISSLKEAKILYPYNTNLDNLISEAEMTKNNFARNKDNIISHYKEYNVYVGDRLRQDTGRLSGGILAAIYPENLVILDNESFTWIWSKDELETHKTEKFFDASLNIDAIGNKGELIFTRRIGYKYIDNKRVDVICKTIESLWDGVRKKGYTDELSIKSKFIPEHWELITKKKTNE